jgi:hypothetical protein
VRKVWEESLKVPSTSEGTHPCDICDSRYIRQ